MNFKQTFAEREEQTAWRDAERNGALCAFVCAGLSCTKRTLLRVVAVYS